MKQIALISMLAFFLAGCAIIREPARTEPGVTNASAWQARQRVLRDFDVWSLQGRVATGQLLGWTGNLSWRQRSDDFRVRLAGPLGAGGFRARGTLDRVVIQTRDRRLVTTDPDALVEETLGWRFPLEPLRYWARGLPAPGDYDSISVDGTGHMTGLEQRGWRLAIQEYTQPDNAPELPRRIVLDNGDTRIRLVVDRWFDIDGAHESGTDSAQKQ